MKKIIFIKKSIQHFIYLLFFILLGINLVSGQTTVIPFNANGTWTCPIGVTSIQVEAWGAGGGGGGSSSSTNYYPGAGGAGGNYARNSNITVSPETVYTINVGAAGTAGTTSSTINPYGGNGGTSSFGTVLYASGGTGGYGGMTNNKNGSPGKNGGIYNINYSQAGATWTVAPTGIVGTPWAATTEYTLNTQVFNEGNLYTVTTAGTTGSTAPIHTTDDIVDGTATLTYAGEAAKVSFSASNFTYIMTMNPGSGYLVAPPIVISGTTIVGGPPTAVAFINPINVTGADTYYIGGNGSIGMYVSKDVMNTGGGGGGSAGTESNGNSAVLNIGGLAVTGGTAGASATPGLDATGITGIAAASYGGGGSGGRGPSTTGGRGGNGRVVITIPDNIPPMAAGAVVVSNPTISSVALNWIASVSSRTDAINYLVVRYNSSPNANNDPTQKKTYLANQTITAGTDSLIGTVVYSGSSLEFVDIGLDSLTTYFYKVYAYDPSHNYAVESSVTATTTNQQDNTPPGAPGAVSISNQTTSSLTTSWLAASSIEGGGYLVVRYSGTPEVDSNPVQKFIYAIGDTYATGTPVETVPPTAAKVAKVVYVGRDLSIVNLGLTSGHDYHFKVYTFDQAYNYSESSYIKGRTSNQLIAPFATPRSEPNASGFMANWESVADATSYEVAIYTSGASQDNIVGWTIPTSITDAVKALPANITTANNTSKVLTNSSNSSINANVSGNPGFAARGTGYYSQYISSGSVATNDAVYSYKATPDKYWQVEVNTVGYRNITVSSQQYSTNTLPKAAVTADPTATPPIVGSAAVLPSSGPRDFKLQYGLDGESGTFTDVPNATVLVDEYWTTTLNTNTSGDLNNIILPDECNNHDSVLLRWVQTSFIGVNGTAMTTPDTGGTSRIDNIYVKGKKLSILNSVLVEGNSSLSKAFTGLIPGDEYFYDVVAKGTNTNDNSSNVLTTYNASTHSNLVSARGLYPLDPSHVDRPFDSFEDGFSVSWDAVKDAKDYTVYIYNTNTQEEIVGWNFAKDLVATSTSTNNINNAIVQSKGTPKFGTISNNTCVTATTSSWLPAITPPIIDPLTKKEVKPIYTNWVANKPYFVDDYVYVNDAVNPLTDPPIYLLYKVTVAGTSTTAPTKPQNGGISYSYAGQLTPSLTNWELKVNTLGYRNTKVSSKQYASQAATAARDFKVQYKIGVNGTYADVPLATIIVAKDWNTGVLQNVSLPTECDNQPLVYLRWINYTTRATDGKNINTNGGVSLADVHVTGALLVSEPEYPQTFDGTSTTFYGLPPNTYYFNVVANPKDSNAYAPSFPSNLGTIGPINAPVATLATNLTNTGFTANWEEVNDATDYDLNVYRINPTSSTIIGWTFPTSWVAASNITLPADAYTDTNNSVINVFSQSNNTITPLEGSPPLEGFPPSFAASSATYYSNLGSGVILEEPAKYWQVVVNTKSRFNLKVSSKQWSSIDAEVLPVEAVIEDLFADPPVYGVAAVEGVPATSGPRDFTLQYSITGKDGPYIDVDNGGITVGNDWTTGVLDHLELPVECENQEKLYLRWTQASFTGLDGKLLENESGSNRIDDILIEGSSLELVDSISSLGTVSSYDYENTDLDSDQIYYYTVIAKSTEGYYPSANSNLIKTTDTETLSLVSFKSSITKAYPNPVTNGKLFISSPNSSEKQVAVYSILGQKVLDTKTTNNAEINVSKLARGMYILKISEDGKSEAKKLIIQ